MPRIDTIALLFLFALGLCVATSSFLAIMVSPAHAQVRCGDRLQVITALEERFGETRRSVALTADNAIVEVFASDISGSWTITTTTPDGQTCIVAAGDAYEAIHEKRKGTSL